ncbi:MAG: MBOAT family protein [Oscillospiraceae bacterium]|nr:MBOAT family protein [Oscillospiraceae bacterium]
MVFSSILFLFVFLPLLLIYYLAPFRFKNFVIMILSFVFYSWGEPKYFFIMIFTILINYVLAIILENNINNKIISKLVLSTAVLFNLGELFFFKYYNFFIENINYITGLKISFLRFTLPLGISFYIFQILSYVIDVYRNKIKAEKNIVDFSAFVVLFPQLIAGPIVKYTDINKELKYREITLDKIQDGIRLFILGLGKKVLIANNVGCLWSEIENIGLENISFVLAWLGLIAFAIQIYFDFSGYSLMAIGLGKMLGFEFPKNFDFPYISKSVTEFWRRWHITLSSWFKEYLYIPLGGNRCSNWRRTFNLFIVWFSTGFWHGANWNFIFWGLFFFLLLTIEKIKFKKFCLLDFLNRHKIFSHIYLLFIILISWALFAVDDINKLKIFIFNLFNFNFKLDWVYYLKNYFIILILSIILSTPLIFNFYNKKIKSNIFLDTIVLIILLILSVAYLVDATYNPFLYFRF